MIPKPTVVAACIGCVAALGGGARAVAAPGATPIRVTVEPGMRCPATDALAAALARRLPAELWLRDGPDHLDLDVERLGDDRLRVSLTDGQAQVERVVAVDHDDCDAVADTVALLAATWLGGHAWWGAAPPAAEPDDDASDGPLAPRVREAPRPQPAVPSLPPPADDVAPRLVRRRRPLPPRFGLRLGARAAFAYVDVALQSNGTRPGSDYAGSTWLAGAVADVAYTHAVTRHVDIGVDTSFGVVTGAVNAPTVTGTGPTGARDLMLDVGAGAGLHAAALGGVQARARVGFAMLQELIDPVCCATNATPVDLSANPPAPSDLVLGLASGLDVEVPALVRVGARALALRLRAAAVAPATRQQTIGLEQGARETTWGARVGAVVAFDLFRGLAVEASWDYAGYWTHFDGAGRRDPSSTAADLASTQQLVAVGLAYQLRPY